MTTIGFAGGSGTLGRAAIPSLLSADGQLQIRALVREADPALAVLDRCIVDSGGIFDAESLNRWVAACDVVVNLAARNPAGQEKDLRVVEDFFLINGLGTGLVAQACTRTGTPLIHFSSVAVYETGHYRSTEELSETEPLPVRDAEVLTYYQAIMNHLREPLTDPSVDPIASLRTFMRNHQYPPKAPVYGLSKLVGEQLALDQTAHQAATQAAGDVAGQACCLRMSDVYGPGHESRGVVANHLASLRDRSELLVDFDFRSSAFFIYLDDVLAVLSQLLDKRLNNEPLPALLNLVGPLIDQPAFKHQLEQLCVDQGLCRSLKLASPTQYQYDRRYSTEQFAQTFPEFRSTRIEDGLPATWQALVA